MQHQRGLRAASRMNAAVARVYTLSILQHSSGRHKNWTTLAQSQVLQRGVLRFNHR